MCCLDSSLHLVFPRSRSDLWTSYAFRNWAPKKNTENITITSLEKAWVVYFKSLIVLGILLLDSFIYILYIYIYLSCISFADVMLVFVVCRMVLRDSGRTSWRCDEWSLGWGPVDSSVILLKSNKLCSEKPWSEDNALGFHSLFCCWSAAVPVPVFAVCRTFRRYQRHSPTLLPLSWRIMSITWKTFQEHPRTWLLCKPSLTYRSWWPEPLNIQYTCT